MLRILIVLLVPTAGLAENGAAGGIVDSGPLFGGPRAVAGVRLGDYPPGQEVLLEIYATSDRPGAERVFLGRSKTVASRLGNFRISLISDPLPDTQSEWKVQYWFSPRVQSGEVDHLSDFTLRRDHLRRK
jgi:hypothetical protein